MSKNTTSKTTTSPALHDNKYLTTAQMRARCKCGRSTLPRLAQRGLIPYPIPHRLCQQNLYLLSEVIAYEARNRKAAPLIDGSDDTHPIDKYLPTIERELALEAIAQRERERDAREAQRNDAREHDRKTRELMQELAPKSLDRPASRWASRPKK